MPMRKPLQEQFADVIVPILKIHGPMDTKNLYRHIQDRAPELCDNRGQIRLWSVWQRDVRNGLKYLQDKGTVALIPRKGFERKGAYHLIK